MKKEISLKSCYGKYKTFTKTFKDQNHFSNWYTLMSNKGHKIIGVKDIKLKT
jgi:hypothetical protein